jgi:hypothetical protein
MWSRLQLETLERNLEEHKKYLEKKEKNTTVQNSSDCKVYLLVQGTTWGLSKRMSPTSQLTSPNRSI